MSYMPIQLPQSLLLRSEPDIFPFQREDLSLQRVHANGSSAGSKQQQSVAAVRKSCPKGQHSGRTRLSFLEVFKPYLLQIAFESDLGLILYLFLSSLHVYSDRSYSASAITCCHPCTYIIVIFTQRDHDLSPSKTFMTASTAFFTPSISASIPPLPKTALQLTYAGFPVLFARILATLVANSILSGTSQSDVHRGSEGWKR